MLIKTAVKKIVPPAAIDFIKYLTRDRQLYYFGDFVNFAEAEKKAKCLQGGTMRLIL